MPRRGYRQRPEHIQRRLEQAGQTITARYGGINKPSILNSALLESAESRHAFMENMCAYAEMVSDDLDTLREIANADQPPQEWDDATIEEFITTLLDLVRKLMEPKQGSPYAGIPRALRVHGALALALARVLGARLDAQSRETASASAQRDVNARLSLCPAV